MAWLYKRGGKWWVGWRSGGRQFLKTTGEKDKALAEKKLREFEFVEASHAGGKLTESFIESITAKPLSQLSLVTAMKGWLDECEGTTDPSTQSRYRGVSDQFQNHLSATETAPLLRDVTPEDIRTFLSKKRAESSASNVNLYRRVLSTFFLRELREGTIRANPCIQVKRFKDNKSEKQARRPFTLAEVKLIHEKAPNLFWRYMIVGAFYTGLRLGDLVQMKWGSVDLDQNVIRLFTKKTGRTVAVPIAAPLKSVLEEVQKIASNTNPGAHLWPSESTEYAKHRAKVFSNQFYDEVLTPAGLATPRNHRKKKGGKGRAAARVMTGVSFHCLRHTFISTLKTTGSNSSIAKELVGHSSDAINDIYTHIPIETLTNAVKALPKI